MRDIIDYDYRIIITSPSIEIHKDSTNKNDITTMTWHHEYNGHHYCFIAKPGKLWTLGISRTDLLISGGIRLRIANCHYQLVMKMKYNNGNLRRKTNQRFGIPYGNAWDFDAGYVCFKPPHVVSEAIIYA